MQTLFLPYASEEITSQNLALTIVHSGQVERFLWWTDVTSLAIGGLIVTMTGFTNAGITKAPDPL